MKVRPVQKWGGHKWVTNEAREHAGDKIFEQVMKKDVLISCQQAGGEPIEEPNIKWDRVFELRRMGIYIPDFISDEDWQLRCSVKCLGVPEEVDDDETVSD